MVAIIHSIRKWLDASSILRIFMFLCSVAAFFYQGLQVMMDYWKYPSTVDARTEGEGTLLYPGLSFCITNWIDKTKLCERFEDACNDTVEMSLVQRIVMTEGNLSDIALDPTNILQIGFVNPAQYYFEFYLNTDITQVSYSLLPTHMCYTMNWRTDTKMEAVHQNIIAFEMNMMVSWPDDEHIQASPYELTLGFHYVDTNTAGQRHAIVLRPSGDYVFGVIQEGTRTLPPPYDTMCRDYSEMKTFDDGYTVRWSRDMCNEDCKMQVVLRVCGCLMSNYIYRNKISGLVCDANATENCVQAHAREMYTTICPTECPAACREDTYKATQSIWRQIGSDDSDLKYVNVKVIVTSRQVDVLHFVPMLTSTQILGIIGGYIGFWMGLSFYKVGAVCARKLLMKAYETFSILGMMRYLVVHKSIKTAGTQVWFYSGLTSLLQCLLLSTIIACGVSCIREFYEYRRYPTTVYYSQDSMDGAAFPATTACLLDGINYSDICSTYLGENCANREPNFESMVGNDIVLMKFIINFTYLPEEVVTDCMMESRSDLCESFDCTDLWNRTFTYVKTGSCYTLDMTTLPDHAFWKCKEQFKYNLRFKVRSFGAKVGGGATMTALVHEQNRYTSGIIHSFRFEPGRKYYLTVAQTHLESLPKPYETGCVDYEKDGKNEHLYQRHVIQEEECCEACVAATWLKHCGCFSKMYAVKHKMTGNVCDYVTHLKCIDRMIQNKWSVGCQGRCTQGCNDKRYRGLMHQIGYLNLLDGSPKYESGHTERGSPCVCKTNGMNSWIKAPCYSNSGCRTHVDSRGLNSGSVSLQNSLELHRTSREKIGHDRCYYQFTLSYLFQSRSMRDKSFPGVNHSQKSDELRKNQAFRLHPLSEWSHHDVARRVHHGVGSGHNSQSHPSPPEHFSQHLEICRPSIAGFDTEFRKSSDPAAVKKVKRLGVAGGSLQYLLDLRLNILVLPE